MAVCFASCLRMRCIDLDLLRLFLPALGGAMGGSLPGPKKIVTKFRVNWGRASAQRLQRVLVDSNWRNMRRPSRFWQSSACSDRGDAHSMAGRRKVAGGFELGRTQTGRTRTGRLGCRARGGCLFDVPTPNRSAFKKSTGSLGCVSQCSDWCLWTS